MILGVAGWRGIGASTTALLCAAAMHRSDERTTALVETDPAGGVLAARLGFRPEQAGSLERLAVAATRRGDGPDLAAHVVGHGGFGVVTAPGDPFRAWSCLAGRSAWIDRLADLADDVVIDLGRLRGGHPAGGLLDRLDALVLVSAPDAVSLAATTIWAEQGGRTSPGDQCLPVDVVRIVVVEAPGSPAASRVDAAAELGERLVGRLPWDPTVVDHVERGGGLGDRLIRRRPLALAVHRLAGAATSWVRWNAGSAA